MLDHLIAENELKENSYYIDEGITDKDIEFIKELIHQKVKPIVINFVE